MGLIHANAAAYTSLYVWSVTKECANRNISNDLWPQQEYFIKIAVLHCNALMNYAVQ